MNAGGVVYGTIIVATLLAAESAQRETYGETVAAVVVALITYWLAVAYSHYAGERLEHEQHFEAAGFARAARRELTLLGGAVIPLVALLVFWAGGAALTTAVTGAVWCAAAVIVLTEVVIGIRAELTGRELVTQTAVGALLGVLVIVLRVVLH